MSNALFVLSPAASSTITAHEFPPFACSTKLEEILDQVAVVVEDSHRQYGDPIYYKRYTIYEGLFYGMTPESVQDGVRAELANTVYTALLDCEAFGNFTSTINTLWALLAFVREDLRLRSIDEEKMIYIIEHKNANKYKEFLPVYSTVISDKTDLISHLVDKLRSINFQEVSKHHPL